MMRSAAKLSYEEAQAAIDGRPSAKSRAAAGRARSSRCGPPTRRSRRRATGASRSTSTCRSARSCSTRSGRVERVVVPERLDAHRLIEEFMIQANVAAAEALEEKRAPVIYRVHDAPSKEKLAGAARLPRQPRPEAARLRARCAPGDFNASCSAPRRCPLPTSSTRWCCARSRRRSTRPRTSATSASTCSATRTSPRRSAATPTSSCTAR